MQKQKLHFKLAGCTGAGCRVQPLVAGEQVGVSGYKASPDARQDPAIRSPDDENENPSQVQPGASCIYS